MTLTKTGLCTYQTYIGDISDCDQYPYYDQQNVLGSGMVSDMRNDIFCANCDAPQCDCSLNLPMSYTPTVGACTGTRVVPVVVTLQKTLGGCECWVATVRFLYFLWDVCGDECTWETRTDCANFDPATGYTNHIPQDANVLVLKNTQDTVGDIALGNISPQLIYLGGTGASETHCPGSSYYNNLCGERNGGSFSLLSTGDLKANSPSSLLGNYTMGNITPACSLNSTSATSLTESSVNATKPRICNNTYGAAHPAITTTITNLTIS